MKIYFYHPLFKGYEERELLELDEHSNFFTTGPNVWVIQTYIKLKLAGYEVERTFYPPRSGLVVMHSHHFFEFWNETKTTINLVFVIIRADREKNIYADFEILQNHIDVDNRACFYVPHWPQPGLVKRNHSRGKEIKTIAFKGFLNNLNDMFAQKAWGDFIDHNCLEWITDAESWKTVEADYHDINWHDYKDIDLIIAIRKDVDNLYSNKPATKLTNSWLAEVPCILGPEVAYRHLRRSDLDYIEADNLESVKTAIQTLIADPTLYTSMIENGKSRAISYSAAKITTIWGELLFNHILKYSKMSNKRLLSLFPLTKRKYLKKMLT